MDIETIEAEIEAGIHDATATVTRPRDDDDHLAATVVSPAFEGKSLVDQHELVYDALEEYMHDEIHALELQTETPDD